MSCGTIPACNAGAMTALMYLSRPSVDINSLPICAMLRIKVRLAAVAIMSKAEIRITVSMQRNVRYPAWAFASSKLFISPGAMTPIRTS